MNTIQTPVSTRIAIVGAGSMGSGLAALFARQGFAVALIDPVDGALAWADAAITRQLTAVGAEVAAVRARIAPSPELAAAASADLVIEAAPERLELKQCLFAELDALCPPHTVFAPTPPACRSTPSRRPWHGATASLVRTSSRRPM